jgi:DNA polymerase-3 subunit delta
MEKAEALLKRIQQKQYQPIYLLQGVDETYFVDLIAKYIEEQVLEEEQKAFNQTILYGKDTDVDELINMAKRFPMMAEYQVIILREAQTMKNIDKLEAYVNQPQPTTILVLCFKYKKPDGRKKVIRDIKAKYEYYETGRIYENTVVKWIESSLKRAGYGISPKAIKMLVEYLGNSISNIDKELEKLKQILHKTTNIVPEHIEKHIGISKDYNNFELNNAVGMKDELKAQKIVKYFTQNPKNHPLVLTLGLLYSYFNKILLYHSLKDKSKYNAARAIGVSPYFVDDYVRASKKYSMKDASRAIELIREADAQGKGIKSYNLNNGDLLKSLLVNVMRH